jgi:quercetin dioxygenase-like cupin family protein
LQPLHKNLANLNWVNAKHADVLKKVCFEGNEFSSNITQVAYTELNQGSKVTAHSHLTMEEVFFLIEGVCEFKIQGETILANKHSIIRIPANQLHSIHAISDCKFFYFGVSI